MDLVIFGAQSIALGAYEAIHYLHPEKNIKCFLVTERGMNPELLLGVPVIELDSFCNSLSPEEKDNIEILIATPENVMPEIEEILDRCGLHCHVRLTSSRWAELMSYHYVSERSYMPLSSFPVGCHSADVHMYMAKFYKDSPLTSRYDVPTWITPIQVGAALCRERVADVLDCDGDNISEKNVNYSELTALYWIWKNVLQSSAEGSEFSYYGLVHYRRILELSEDDALRLADNDIDVILPFPMPYEPNIEAHHERYLKKEDWDAVLKAIQELRPEYAKQFPRILQQRYFYNYNIMLAKKEVLIQYCEWLFPILERVEELSVPTGINRSDRYIGYVGETLATLYFMVNKDKLNVAHAGCRFLT